MNIEALKEAHDLSLDGRDFAARQIILDVIADLEKKEPAQQEPLFWYRSRSDGFYEGPIHNAQIEQIRKDSGGWQPLYTSPPAQRTWVGLTDEDIGMCLDVGDGSMGKIIQAIEAKLKEKNT